MRLENLDNSFENSLNLFVSNVQHHRIEIGYQTSY